MIRLSPGILVSSHHLLRELLEHEEIDTLSRYIKINSIDGTKTLDVVDTIKACKWIEIIGDAVKLTSRGIQIAQNFDIEIRRLMIGDYIKYSNDSWISIVPRGRKECSPYLPPDVLACINKAGLLIVPVTDEIVLWWDQQAQSVRKEQELYTLEIGRIGEKLTIDYEKRRTKKNPIWKSIESNLAGYDVLSIIEEGSTIKLTIEVKTSEKPIEAAYAYITRHEWDVAIDSSNYLFHFWHIEGNLKKLAVLDVMEIKPNIPNDEGDGEWQKVTIPFNIYKEKFQLDSN